MSSIILNRLVIRKFDVGFSTNWLWHPRARTGVVLKGRHGMPHQSRVGWSGHIPQKDVVTQKDAP